MLSLITDYKLYDCIIYTNEENMTLDTVKDGG